MVINIGPLDDTVEIGPVGGSSLVTLDVPGNKDVEVQVPPVPPGTILVIRIGKGLRARRVAVEVVALSP